MISISVLMDIIEDDHKSALLTIAFENQLNGLKNYLNVIKDAAKVISLHYWSKINRAIIENQSYEQVIEPWFQALAFYFVNIIVDDQDNHYKQALSNFKTTYQVASNKMIGYQEKFSQWIQAFENWTIREYDFDQSWTPKYKSDLLQKIDSLNEVKYEKFSECYNSENLGVVYNDLLQSFKTSFMHWIEIHRKIYKKSYNIYSGDEFLEQEKEVGIDLKAFAEE